MWILLLLPIVIAIAGIIILKQTKMWSFPWVKFFLKGKESGFNFKEINLLRKAAITNKLKDPTSLFWSIRALDYSIKGVIVNYRAKDEENSEPADHLISKLFDFRKRVELKLPKYSLGIKSTRDMPEKQRVKISLPTIGPFHSTVVENLRRYLAVSYPQGPKLPPGFSWKNQQISIYFWRPGDAGYFFNTKVLEDYFNIKYPILHIAHTSTLVRSQKRKSVRAEVSLGAMLYPLRHVKEASEEVETGQGLRCRLIDISEDGSALLIGGKAKLGLPIKLQFMLFDTTIVMNGIVKGVNFDSKKNRSILHMQALPVSNHTKNIILSYVYNIFGDRDEARTAIPAGEQEGAE